jgi:hypothetical protein
MLRLRAAKDQSYDNNYHYKVQSFLYNLIQNRSHQGKIHTPFEAREAIRTVSNFIDELETLEVSKDMISDFIKKSKFVI